LWLADTSGIVPVQVTGPDSCGLGLARLATLSGPANSLESLANLVTASFCSHGSGLVYIAQYLIDIPAGARGRFKVVGIDRTDPSANEVVQSPEVTFNGGFGGDFSAAILRVEVQHQSTDYLIRVVGAGLSTVHEASLVAPDQSWEEPLALATVSDTELNATASLAAWVPECMLKLTTTDGRVTVEGIPADPPPAALSPTAACQARFIEDVYPPAVIQPKDFAFVPGGWSETGSWTFHLFYIRQNQIIRNKPGGAALTEKNLGHAVSNDLNSWTVLDTAAIHTRTGSWDSQHVWAPTIIRKGVRYYMFYTGVDDAGTQSIGRATSTDLVHWNQEDQVLTPGTAGTWVDASKKELRDAFVMEDPNVPGQYLMYFTAQTNEYPGMATGFVRSSSVTFAPSEITSGGALWATQQNRQSGLESPHVFQRSGKWWLFFTKPVGTQDTIYALSTATSPTDTVTSNWSSISSIRVLVPLGEATAYTFWHGTEYLQIAGPGGGKEYFAGFNDSDQSISYTQMRQVPPPELFAGDCPDALGAPPRSDAPDLRVLGAGRRSGTIDLEVTLPSPSRVSVAIHDVLGRRMATLANSMLPAGRTNLSWKGSDARGGRASSGIYFVTLTFAQGRRTARTAFLR